MKYRFFRMCLIFVLMLLIATSAYAVNTGEYELEELGLTVSMPSDYIVFTRDISASDPNLSAYGLTKDGMSSLMSESNIYLNGWDENVNQEIIITMIDSPLVDFNLYSDTTLTTTATSFEEQYKSVGVTVIKSEIYQHAQAKFLKIYISQPNEDATVYGLQYYTVYDDKAINITMQSYSGQITSSKEATLKSIVDSTVFNSAPQTVETDFTPTNAFTYTDPKTQAAFTVPANWVETPLSEERESIDVKFTSLEEDGMSIMYGSFDMWNEMAASERSGCNRSDVNNSILTKSDIADIFSVSTNDIKSVMYGGNEYYTATVTSNAEVYGLNFTVTMTHMLFVNNGYMYWFQFSGASDHDLYKDFVSILSSLQLAAPERKSTMDNSTDFASQFSLENILLSLLVTTAIYSLPIIIYRYAVKKTPLDRTQAKKITIIYGICAFLVMSVIIFVINGSVAASGAIFLWSWVNYRVLIGGKAKEITPELVENNAYEDFPSDYSQNPQKTETGKQAPNSVPKNEPTEKACPICGTSMPIKSKFCHKCGYELIGDSGFCSNCGTKVCSDDHGDTDKDVR